MKSVLDTDKEITEAPSEITDGGIITQTTEFLIKQTTEFLKESETLDTIDPKIKTEDTIEQMIIDDQSEPITMIPEIAQEIIPSDTRDIMPRLDDEIPTLSEGKLQIGQTL